MLEIQQIAIRFGTPGPGSQQPKRWPIENASGCMARIHCRIMHALRRQFVCDLNLDTVE